MGAEGIDVTDGENIVLADSPEAFAQKVVELFQDSALKKKLSEKGRELAISTYEWEIIGEKLVGTYEGLLT